MKKLLIIYFLLYFNFLFSKDTVEVQMDTTLIKVFKTSDDKKISEKDIFLRYFIPFIALAISSFIERDLILLKKGKGARSA